MSLILEYLLSISKNYPIQLIVVFNLCAVIISMSNLIKEPQCQSCVTFDIRIVNAKYIQLYEK